MSKIVSAVNSMASNKEKIGPVMLGRGDEIFFTYDGKYNWSMTHSNDNYFLFFYPPVSQYTLSQLASVDEPNEWENMPMVRYDAKELGTREAMQTFADLHTIIKEKVYGVDEVLDEIIDGF